MYAKSLKFKRLFEPIKIGNMELKNRIVMPAMDTDYAKNGVATKRLINYYSRRARGGVGLVIVEPLLLIKTLQPRRLNELAKSIQLYGAKVAMQLYSDIPRDTRPEDVSIKKVEGAIETFVKKAREVKTAGFDAIEIQGAHGYLLTKFLSPYWNKRKDTYGGSLDGRIRIAVEVVNSVREEVGENYPIVFRLSGCEFMEGGLELRETRIIAKKLEDAGASAINVSAGNRQVHRIIVSPMCIPPGYLVNLAEGIKNTVNVPVMTVGRINDPVIAERILEEGRADLLCMGRALIADPELPNKTAEGRLNEIRKCLGCNTGCTMHMSHAYAYPDMICNVNPEVGREGTHVIKPAKKPKKVIVVGGGPAGMEATSILRARGHDVTLFEKEKKLGGQLLLSIIPPHKKEIGNLIEYLTFRLKKLGARIELGKEVSSELIDKISPDVVVIATGAVPYIPKILGIGKKNVVTAWEVLSGNVTVKGDIVVAGGGMVGCETAEFLAEKDCKVTIVEMLDTIAKDMGAWGARYFLQERFIQHGIRVFINTKVEEITDEGVVVIDGKRRKTLEANMVVLALGAVANNSLAQELHGKALELYIIGDCFEPRRIHEAIYEGWNIGHKI